MDGEAAKEAMNYLFLKIISYFIYVAVDIRNGHEVFDLRNNKVGEFYDNVIYDRPPSVPGKVP